MIIISESETGITLRPIKHVIELLSHLLHALSQALLHVIHIRGTVVVHQIHCKRIDILIQPISDKQSNLLLLELAVGCLLKYWSEEILVDPWNRFELSLAAPEDAFPKNCSDEIAFAFANFFCASPSSSYVVYFVPPGVVLAVVLLPVDCCGVSFQREADAENMPWTLDC